MAEDADAGDRQRRRHHRLADSEQLAQRGTEIDARADAQPHAEGGRASSGTAAVAEHFDAIEGGLGGIDRPEQNAIRTTHEAHASGTSRPGNGSLSVDIPNVFERLCEGETVTGALRLGPAEAVVVMPSA